ncbi:hypothetical protein APUTEX25_000111, partial [Auxenochlorella protothecoides]
SKPTQCLTGASTSQAARSCARQLVSRQAHAALPSAASSQAGSVAGDNPHQPADGVASSRSRRADFADLQAHIAELTEERFALQRGLAQQAQQAATVTAEHESMVQAFNQQARKGGAVVEALQHEVSALREQLAEAMAREESLAQHRDALTHAATAAQERAQDLAMEVVALEESLLQHKSATLKQGVEEGAAAGTAARLQTQLMSSERQRHDLEEDLRSLREENAALKDQLRAAFAAKDEGVAEKQAVGVASRSAAGAGAAHETDHAGILSAPDPPVPETGEAETARTTWDPLAPRAPAPAPTHGPGPPPGLPRPEPELRQGSAALPAALELLLPRYTLVQAEEGGLMESEAVLETVQSIQGLLTSLGARQGELLAALRRKEIGGLITSRFIGITPDSSLTRLDVSADDQDNFDVVETEGKPVGGKEVALLGDLSRWLEDPDHRRVQFITSILGLLWPTLSSAVYKEVLVQAKQPLEDACKMTNGLVASLAITKLDLGTIPPRLDSFKTMHSESDELILEAPLFWGSDLKAAVSAVLKVGKFGLIEVPVEIANVQIKALARITIKPLVETLPCFGGITLSLMEAPHVDLDVHLAGSADLLALPLVPEAVKLAIKIFAGQMLVYPNEISVPIMENFGVVNGKNLKSSWFDKVDPFVKVEVREGKGLQTTTIDNNSHPEWNETMLFVVDDPLKQSVKICVMDEDVMSSDVVGVAEVPLKGAEFMLQAGRSVRATIPIREPPPQDDAVMHPEAAPDAHEVARDLKGENATDAQAAGAVVEVGPSSETSTPRESGDTGASGGGTPEKKEKKISKLLRKLKLKKGPSHHEEDTASSNVTTHAKHSPASKKKEGHRKKHGKDAQGEVTGHLTLEFKFTPFRGAATVTDGLEEPKRVAPRQAGPGCGGRGMARGGVSRSTTKRPRAEDRGLLSLDLKRCIALEEEADTFVQLTLHDPTRGSSSDTVYKTPVVLEEQNPQYRFKTDFVNVSAMSTLTLTVFQRPSFTASTMGKIPFVHKAKAKQMGYVQIKARNVVDEERISGKWALQEAQTGEMDLAISWHAIDVEDFGDL